MKGLRLYLPPFAPDDAGAASVLQPLGGLVTILDAGGCAGNLCGFDEPRFYQKSSGLPQNHEPSFASIFASAALRDMDAILGRDVHLLKKLCDAVDTFAASNHPLPFLAFIGTPVPAVIGTALHALARLAEQQLHIPTIPIDTDGTQPYDTGIEKAYHALFSHLANIPNRIRPHHGSTGVLGATTFDVGTDAALLRTELQAQGFPQPRLYGLSHNLRDYIDASENELNLVLAPSGLPAARWLQKNFGTPYRILAPLARHHFTALQPHLPDTAKNILILHQQFTANALRTLLKKKYPESRITCATWFTLIGALAKPQDQKLRDEHDFPRLVATENYDLILADPLCKRTIPAYHGTFLPLPHPAVSGFPD